MIHDEIVMQKPPEEPIADAQKFPALTCEALLVLMDWGVLPLGAVCVGPVQASAMLAEQARMIAADAESLQRFVLGDFINNCINST